MTTSLCLSNFVFVSMILCLLFFWGKTHSKYRKLKKQLAARIHSEQVIFGQARTETSAKQPLAPNPYLTQYVASVTDDVNRLLDQYPDIFTPVREAQKLYSTMSPELRNQLSFALGPEFQQGMTQLASQELQAAAKLSEMRLRMVLSLQKDKIDAIAIPERFTTRAKAAVELSKRSHDQLAEVAEDEAAATVIKLIAARAYEDLVQGAGTKDQPLASAEMVALLLTTGDKAKASPEVGHTPNIEFDEDEEPFVDDETMRQRFRFDAAMEYVHKNGGYPHHNGNGHQ